MMDYRTNVKAILETCFAGYKDELIEAAADRICSIKITEKPLYMVRADGSIESIKPEIKRGRWLKQIINGHQVDLCSKCWCTCHKLPTWHYCPRCGSKNENGGEDDKS